MTGLEAGADHRAARVLAADDGVIVREHDSSAKRALDIALSVVALVPALPLVGLAAAGIWLEDGRPIFFRQRRVGRGGRDYEVLKLRSMRVNTLPPEKVGQVREDHELVTRTGRVIRRLKIDELPQLMNVLRGDMSLVGPRPTIRDQVDRYDAFQRRRLLVRPGLTGWAQVNGNTSLTWSERIALDVWYVDHRTFWLDLQILFRTVRVVLFGERPNPAALERARAHADGPGRRG